MKILIATKNNSKFEIISRMLYSILGNNILIKSLNDYDYFVDKDEIGTNIERAKAKAKNAEEQIKEDFDYILGIDDGIIIDGKEYVTVKDHLYDIVVGDKIKIGSIIYITRAYFLISNDKKEVLCYNKIPNIVRKKLDTVEMGGGYPLNSVISTIDNDTVLTERSNEELNDYFLKYSIDDLRTMFNNVDKELK